MRVDDADNLGGLHGDVNRENGESRSDTLLSAQTPRPGGTPGAALPDGIRLDVSVAPNDERSEEWCARLESNQRPRA